MVTDCHHIITFSMLRASLSVECYLYTCVTPPATTHTYINWVMHEKVRLYLLFIHNSSLSLWSDARSFPLMCGCLFTGVAARETAQALRTLAQAARGVAASTKEPQAAAAMLDSAQYVMEGSAMLIHEAHQALVHPGDAESQQRLAQVAQLPVI